MSIDPKYVNYNYRKEQLWGEKLQDSTKIFYKINSLKLCNSRKIQNVMNHLNYQYW